jgi:hypothetical protein
MDIVYQIFTMFCLIVFYDVIMYGRFTEMERKLDSLAKNLFRTASDINTKIAQVREERKGLL